MSYTIILEDRKEVRRLVGPRPFSELLTREELEQVRRGELIGLNAHGGVLALSSPLEDGAQVTLCADQDFSAIGVPANQAGELVGVSEAHSIRKYEYDQHVNLWDRPLAEIRELLVLHAVIAWIIEHEDDDEIQQVAGFGDPRAACDKICVFKLTAKLRREFAGKP